MLLKLLLLLMLKAKRTHTASLLREQIVWRWCWLRIQRFLRVGREQDGATFRIGKLKRYGRWCRYGWNERFRWWCRHRIHFVVLVGRTGRFEQYWADLCRRWLELIPQWARCRLERFVRVPEGSVDLDDLPTNDLIVRVHVGRIAGWIFGPVLYLVVGEWMHPVG